MLQGIYLASQGMTTLAQKQEQIANNLANINTTGFKQSGLFAKAYEKYLANNLREPFANREIKADEVYVDYSEGPTKLTQEPLDMAIKGSGFFTVMGPAGAVYTRNGNFALDPNGYLVTNEGYKVMGKDGYIRLDGTDPVRVSDNGEVLQGTETKGFLRIADFKKPYALLRQGSSFFVPKVPDNPVIASPGYVVKQGFLEASNVNPIRNMVDMIAAFRNFEADQKALLAQDESLDKAVNQVGRL